MWMLKSHIYDYSAVTALEQYCQHLIQYPMTKIAVQAANHHSHII